MSQGNPPSMDDRTIIIPVPGGRQSDIQRPNANLNPSPTPPPSQHHAPIASSGQLNPLENAASALLALLTRLRNSQSHPDPNKLRKQVETEIKTFQSNAQRQHIDTETIYVARYVLCTALDEAVLNTPWGQHCSWAQHSLLSSFHQEVSGGERFFLLLKSLAQQPEKNINTLEIMYICLSLGFEGKYRIMDDGQNTLVRVKEWLFEIIQKQRGTSEKTLSPHWQGENQSHIKPKRLIPLWALLSIAIGLLTAIYILFLFQINKYSDPVFSQILAIEDTLPEQALPPRQAVETGLRALLKNEILQHKITLNEDGHKSIITIQGDGLFGSGKAQINAEVMPLLKRISAALEQTPGKIKITGHTDNVPIFTPQYASNWALSKARAIAVTSLIRKELANAKRISAEGLAGKKDIASNETAEGRAKNRRVEIILFPSK